MAATVAALAMRVLSFTGLAFKAAQTVKELKKAAEDYTDDTLPPHFRKLLVRLEALSVPLQLCQSWTTDKHSSLQGIANYAGEILESVHRHVQQAGDPAAANRVPELLTELDFVVNSLTLALAVINQAIPTQPNEKQLSPTMLARACLLLHGKRSHPKHEDGEYSGSIILTLTGDFHRLVTTASHLLAWKLEYHRSKIQVLRLTNKPFCYGVLVSDTNHAAAKASDAGKFMFLLDETFQATWGTRQSLLTSPESPSREQYFDDPPAVKWSARAAVSPEAKKAARSNSHDYAFVFTGDESSERTKASEKPPAVLDLYYVLALCMFEATEQRTVQDSTDEAVWLFFQTKMKMQRASTPISEATHQREPARRVQPRSLTYPDDDVADVTKGVSKMNIKRNH